MAKLPLKNYRSIVSGEEKELLGLKQISRQQFLTILKEAKVNESIIVDKT
jgi:hypothetical protein